MVDITLTDEQNQAIKEFFNWFNNFKLKYSKRFFFISGPAGTGKTTLCRFILDDLNSSDKTVCCCAFTGKASVNFKEKTGYPSNTIHSCIYKPVMKDGKVVDWKLNFYDSPFLECDLIIIDEISMVYKELWLDILKYNKPILVFGDLNQLPPVNNDIIFSEINVDFNLTQIHRQALENPIIRLSIDVRNETDIPYGNFEDKVLKIRRDEFDLKNILKFDQVLCGRNVTRVELNNYTRQLLGYTTQLPSINEKLICLRNNRDAYVFNGQILNTISNPIKQDKKRGTFDIRLDYNEGYSNVFTIFDDEFLRKDIREERWRILRDNPWFCQFDFSYTISVHKSQGSEWNTVCLFDESYCFRESRWKWLYTGITRCKDKLLIIK